MSAKQVYDYLGGNVGRDKVYKLMKANVIKSVWLSGKLVAESSSVDDFVDSLFCRSNDKIIESTPVELINGIVKSI